MSEIFQFPFRPLDWVATPKDFAESVPDAPFLSVYTSETTQRFVYGTRYITWDGRVFKYMGLTTGGCVSYHGVASTAAAVLSFTTNPVEVPAGSLELTATVASITEDQLAGAFVEIYKSTIDNSEFRAIVGNEATVGSTTRMFLEAPLATISTTSDSHEIFPNPYRLTSETTNQFAAWVGVPGVTASSGENVWCQTWGPALISPVNTSLDDAAANERMTFWAANAGILEVDAATGAGKNQVAGYILHSGTGGIAGPMIFLMCST